MSANGFQAFDVCFGSSVVDGEQGDAVRKLTCFLDLFLVACEANPSVAEHFLGHSEGFFQGAMKHGDDALLLTFVQQLFQGGDGGTKLGVRGGQHIVVAQFLEGHIGQLDGFFQRGVVLGQASGAVERIVVKNHHHLVLRVMHVTLDARVAHLLGHSYGSYTVFGYHKLFFFVHCPTSAVGEHGRKMLYLCRYADGNQTKQKSKEYFFHKDIFYRFFIRLMAKWCPSSAACLYHFIALFISTSPVQPSSYAWAMR